MFALEKASGLVVALCLLAWPGRATAADTTTMGDLRVATPTVHSIGFEWDMEGDDNHNATCQVRCRVKGAPDWKDSLPLLRIDYQGWYSGGATLAYKHFNMFAGSIMFLNSATEYEVELSVCDLDGGTGNQSLTIKTLPEPARPGAVRTFHVVPGSGGGSGTKANPFRGFAAAEAVAQPGDAFLVHKGTYPDAYTLTKSGLAGKYIVWRSAGDGAVTIADELALTADHLWIEGFTFAPTGAAEYGGVRGYGHGHKDIVIVRNIFRNSRYSVSNTEQSWNGDPNVLDRQWYIADNVCEGGPMTEYFTRIYMLADSDICHNRITTTMNDKGGDGIALRYCTNIDVYDNDLRELDDDGFEPDYAYANIRIWRNRIVNPRWQGVSFQPMLCSPWYVVRNEFVFAYDYRHATPFKTNVFDRFVLVNNTFVVRGRYAQAHADILLRTFSRNNLWIYIYDNPDIVTNPGGALWYGYGDPYPDGTYTIHGQSLPDWKTDVDYDGFDWEELSIPNPPDFIWWGDSSFHEYNDLASFAAAKNIEQHAIRVHRSDIFNYEPLAYALEAYPSKRLTLKAGCNAIDAGDVVANLSEDYSGAAPDLGAYEYGSATPQYGPRSPKITSQPKSKNVRLGESAVFGVRATGAKPLSFRWERRLFGSSAWRRVGTNSRLYRTPRATLALNSSRYRCIVSNGILPNATSKAAILRVSRT